MTKPKTITVICGRFYGNDQPHFQNLALQTGKLLAENNYRVATGGGMGQMCDVNTAAHKGGAEVVSICLDIPEENTCEFYTEKHVFSEISFRQKALLDLADGIIMLPGGLGTVYELADILIRKHFGSYPKDAPIIVVDKKYYKTLEDFFNHASEVGFIEHAINDMFICVDTPEEAIVKLNEIFQK